MSSWCMEVDALGSGGSEPLRDLRGDDTVGEQRGVGPVIVDKNAPTTAERGGHTRARATRRRVRVEIQRRARVAANLALAVGVASAGGPPVTERDELRKRWAGRRRRGGSLRADVALTTRGVPARESARGVGAGHSHARGVRCHIQAVCVFVLGRRALVTPWLAPTMAVATLHVAVLAALAARQPACPPAAPPEARRSVRIAKTARGATCLVARPRRAEVRARRWAIRATPEVLLVVVVRLISHHRHPRERRDRDEKHAYAHHAPWLAPSMGPMRFV